MASCSTVEIPLAGGRKSKNKLSTLHALIDEVEIASALWLMVEHCGEAGNLPPVVQSLWGLEIRDLFDFSPRKKPISHIYAGRGAHFQLPFFLLSYTKAALINYSRSTESLEVLGSFPLPIFLYNVNLHCVVFVRHVIILPHPNSKSSCYHISTCEVQGI